MEIVVKNQTKKRILMGHLKSKVQMLMEKLSFSKDSELFINFVDDKFIKRLNLKFRKINKATDVLSFGQNSKIINNNLIGDIIISVETATVNAKKNEHCFYLEIMYLIIHALLHLKGYQHSNKMFKIQDNLFSEVIDDYREHK